MNEDKKNINKKDMWQTEKNMKIIYTNRQKKNKKKNSKLWMLIDNYLALF